MPFPIDVSAYRPLSLDPSALELSAEQRSQWQTNIGLMRDDGERLYAGEHYTFEPGTDLIVREGSEGWVIS